MHPILFKIGPFVIYSYGVMLAIAFIISILFIIVRARRYGLKEEIIISLSIYVIIFSIIGARLLYVILNFSEFQDNPLEILMIHHGGLVFYGGLLGGLFGGVFYLKRNKLPVAQTLDIIAPYIALGQAIARIGCLLNGCCYGKPVPGGLGLIFPPNSVAGMQYPGYALYPTQIYSSLANLGIFLILLKLSEFKKKEGEVFTYYLLLYSIKRFFIEFLRGDSFPLLFGLTSFQIISFAIGIISLIWLFKKNGKRIQNRKFISSSKD